MPVAIQSLNAGKGLLYINRGELVQVESARANELLREVYEVPTLRFCVIDNRDVLKDHQSTADIQKAVDYSIGLSKILPKLIVAIITPADVSFGLGRMWEMLSSQTGWSVCVARDGPSAEAWLQEEYLAVYGEPLGELIRGEVLVPEVEGAE